MHTHSCIHAGCKSEEDVLPEGRNDSEPANVRIARANQTLLINPTEGEPYSQETSIAITL